MEARAKKRKNAFKELVEEMQTPTKKNKKEWNKGQLIVACTYKELGVESSLKQMTIDELRELWDESGEGNAWSDSESEDDNENDDE